MLPYREPSVTDQNLVDIADAEAQFVVGEIDETTVEFQHGVKDVGVRRPYPARQRESSAAD